MLLVKEFKHARHIQRQIQSIKVSKVLAIYLWLYSTMLGLGLFFSLFIFYTVGRTPWTGDQPVAGPLLAHRKYKQNKRTQTFMP
jgi:hypothetical protein